MDLFYVLGNETVLVMLALFVALSLVLFQRQAQQRSRGDATGDSGPLLSLLNCLLRIPRFFLGGIETVFGLDFGIHSSQISSFSSRYGYRGSGDLSRDPTNLNMLFPYGLFEMQVL